MEEKDAFGQQFSSFHSAEVQEIMGRRPAWILRWGITVIIAVVLGIIAACWFIKYPQTVTASITLTSDNPPSDLAARTTGILDSVYVAGGDTVRQGQLLALIASAALYEDIVRAERWLWQAAATDSPPPSLRLGNLQPSWIAYCSASADYCDYLRIDQIGRKKDLLSAQVHRSMAYYRKLEQQRGTLEEDLAYERRTLERDSLLCQKGAIAQAEYEVSLKAYVSKKNSLAGFDAAMESARLSRLQLEQQLLELDTQRRTEAAAYEREIARARENLLGQMALWKEQYAIIAPCDGVVSLQNVWSRGQRVSGGELIASVAPSGGTRIMGRLKVPSAGFGKVKAGQQVNIKLSGFPYLEFGILKGRVASISSVPENTPEGIAYTVDVALPNGLESSYHKQFPFVQNMDGSAEIITEDMRLIEQFIRPIRSLFVNR